jgi:hypothetical protein
MVFVWRGKGWIVPIILLGCPVVFELVFEKLNGPSPKRPDGSDLHVWPLLLGMVLGGVFLFVWGMFLNNRPPVRAIERMTGREILVKPSHSMYGLKVEYWGVVSLAGAILLVWFRGIGGL